MGALKGAITYAKFYVRGTLPEDVHGRFLPRIRTRAFKPLTPDDADDLSAGWLPIESPLEPDASFRSDGVFFGAWLNLALRVDRWKFPSTLVKAKVAAAERAYKEKHGRERLSKQEKTEIRELVDRKLRRDGTPVTKVADLSWNLQTMELRFFARSKVLIELLHELFEKTFSVRLVPAGPYPTALAIGLPKDLEPRLAEVQGVATVAS